MELDSDNELPNYLLGKFYINEKKYKSAIECFNNALAINPLNAHLQKELDDATNLQKRLTDEVNEAVRLRLR